MSSHDDQSKLPDFIMQMRLYVCQLFYRRKKNRLEVDTKLTKLLWMNSKHTCSFCFLLKYSSSLAYSCLANAPPALLIEPPPPDGVSLEYALTNDIVGLRIA